MSEINAPLPPSHLENWAAPEAADSYGATLDEASLRLKNEQDAQHFRDGDLVYGKPDPKSNEPLHLYADKLAKVIRLPERDISGPDNVKDADVIQIDSRRRQGVGRRIANLFRSNRAA